MITPDEPKPGDDGDRDAEDADTETPVPVLEPSWQDEMRWYHSHLCECSACAEAEHNRQARIKEWLKIASEW